MRLYKLHKKLVGSKPNKEAPSLSLKMGDIIQFNHDQGTDSYYLVRNLFGCFGSKGQNGIEIKACDKSGIVNDDQEVKLLLPSQHKEEFTVIGNLNTSRTRMSELKQTLTGHRQP